jgi:hypothetical protein
MECWKWILVVERNRKATKTWENGTLKMDFGDWNNSRNKTKIEP